MNWLKLNPGCHVPDFLQEITCIGEEEPADTKGIKSQQIREQARISLLLNQVVSVLAFYIYVTIA